MDEFARLLKILAPTRAYLAITRNSFVGAIPSEFLSKDSLASALGAMGVDSANSLVAQFASTHAQLVQNDFGTIANQVATDTEKLRALTRQFEPDFQIAKAFRANALEQLGSFDQMIAANLGQSFQRASLFEAVGSFAELGRVAQEISGWIEGIQTSVTPMGGTLFNPDLETEHEEEQQDPNNQGDRLLILPEDLQQGIIDVRCLPLLFLSELLKHPRETLYKLSWQQLEELIAEICKRLGGTDIYLTRNSTLGDHGLDVVGTFGVDGIRTVVGYQCKRNKPSRKVGGNVLRELCGALSLSPHNASKGVLCTTAGLERQASAYIAQSAQLSAWTADDIVARIRGIGKPY